MPEDPVTDEKTPEPQPPPIGKRFEVHAVIFEVMENGSRKPFQPVGINTLIHKNPTLDGAVRFVSWISIPR